MTHEIDADAEWIKFMSRITRQQNCEDDEYESEDNSDGRGFDMMMSNTNAAATSPATMMTTKTTAIPTMTTAASAATTATATTATAAATAATTKSKPRKSCISKKTQRRSYSFVDNTLAGDEDAEAPPIADAVSSVAESSSCVSSSTDPVAVSDIRKNFSPIYISTKTKIAYLNKPVDIYDAFWKIPVQHYYKRSECVIKKQIKFQTTDPACVASIKEKLQQQPRYYEEFIIEHIDNPFGRIPYKDQRKVSIGMSRKDISVGNNKKKRAFFNCFVLILRINGGIAPVDERAPEDDILYKEMHVKVFNTGKLEIPGIQEDHTLVQVLQLLVRVLRPLLGDDLDYLRNRCETALINSNFNCGFYIDRDRLFQLLKYKYRLNCNYDSCSYPGIQSKFYYIPTKSQHEQNGQQPVSMDMPYYEVSFMLFRTGSILIVGKCNEEILNVIYRFICSILETEYSTIQMGPVISAVGGGGGAGGGGAGGGGGGAGGAGNHLKNSSRRKKLSTTTIQIYKEESE